MSSALANKNIQSNCEPTRWKNLVVAVHIYTGRGKAIIYLHDKQDEVTTRISKKEKKNGVA